VKFHLLGIHLLGNMKVVTEQDILVVKYITRWLLGGAIALRFSDI
jgi:hypothetical protein